MADVQPDSAQTRGLLERLRGGETEALDRLLARYRRRLLGFVKDHLDPRVRTRVDPSDVVQETKLQVTRQIADFLERRPMPFHLWIRKTAYQRLLNVHRYHLRQRRAVGREERMPERSSWLVAKPLLARHSSPSQHLLAREFAQRVSQAVATLPEADREILIMRHAEELPYEEIGVLLEVTPAAARKRYGRALLRLRQTLLDHGVLEDDQR